MIGRRSESKGHWRSKLRVVDALQTGTLGVRSNKGRTMLTSTGIAIGIASMIAVVGISASSRADLLAEIDSLGTNLLEVRGGSDIFGEGSELPVTAPSMVRRIEPVTSASSLAQLDTQVYRTRHVEDPNNVRVFAVESSLLVSLEGSLRAGRFLEESTAKLPVVVLGSVAAERLGVADLRGGPTVQIGEETFAVIGILEPLPLNPDLDRAALIGDSVAETVLGAEIHPTSIVLRVTPGQVENVRSALPRTVNPEDPNEVSISRPSDALEARARVDEGLQTLLLGLGAVSLVVGGVGIANVMVIGVLERRGEIGLRRALGATRSHIAAQFVLESMVLAAVGGLLGVALGASATYGYATRQGWAVSVPIEALAGGVGAALILGALAGLYPAIRAARLDPADAVRPKA